MPDVPNVPSVPNIDIRPDHWGIVRSIVQKHVPQYAVWAFGSRAKWTAKEYSDLDLAIITDNPLSLDVSASLSDDFGESDLPWKVDVVDWATTSESFRKIIEQDKVVVQTGRSLVRGSGVIAGEWKTLPLEDCMAAIIDYRGKTPEKTTFGVPLVTAKVIKGGRIERPEEFIAEADFVVWMRRGLPNPGDIVMTTEAPLGEVAQLDGRKVALAQRVITLRGKPDLLDNTFLKFLLQSSEVQQELRSRGTGTTVVGIRQSELRKVSLTLPPLAEQKAIAAVLGALDDKIELNRRMNATLEAMARALFQSWFVDFDPVRAKLDARQPDGLDQATAALFPEHFQDSEFGHIPHGWEVKTLSDLTSLITKGTTPTQDDIAGVTDADLQINYVRVNSIDEDGSILPEKLTTIPKSVHAGVLKRSILKADDVLYTIAGTIGRIASAEDWILPANTNQAIAIIRPEPGIPSGFLILTMRHEVFREELHHNIVHAVQANLSLGMLSKARVVVPPETILRKLFAPIDEILRKISANRTQSRTLATLRDTLLPKLLSGELSVSELNLNQAATS